MPSDYGAASVSPTTDTKGGVALDTDELGGKFWFKLVGVCFAGAIVLGIIMLVFSRVAVEWGFLGALLFMCAIGLLVGWWKDRRDTATDIEVDYKEQPKRRA